MQYDVFISCKSEDYKCAEEIYEFLEANGIHTFLASRELRKLGDSEYRKAISKALKSTYHMIVFASQAEYIDTTWVYYEWDWFINAKLKGFKPGQIVTILKDVNVDDVNSDLWKYESFVFSNYKEGLLSYVETPAYLQRKGEEEKLKEEEERARRQHEEEKRIRKEAKDKLIAMAEDYRGKVANLHSVDAKKIVSALRTMGITIHSCPVCKTEVDVEKTYCSTCGWTISPIDDIEGAEYLSLINSSQLDVAKGIYKKLIEADNEVSRNLELLERNLELQDSVCDLKEQAERAKAQAIEMTVKYEEVLHTKEELEKADIISTSKLQELTSTNACIQKELETLRTKTTVLLEQLSNNIQKEKAARMECEQLRDQLTAKEEFNNLACENLTRQITALKNELEHKKEELAQAKIELTQLIQQEAYYTVILKSAGWAKLQTVKVIKDLLDIDLKGAKEIVDCVPMVIANNVERRAAMTLKRELEECGATVEIRSAVNTGEITPVKGENEHLTHSASLLCENQINQQLQPIASIPSSSKKTYTVNGVSFTMVKVTGGTFMMGALDNDRDAYRNEKPAHQVTLSSYSIGETEVTQALWLAVMGSNPSYHKGDLLRPVEQVSWDDCQKFIRKLNSLTGETFRFPTEAEWEYAARGGSQSRDYKYSGSNDIGSVAWYSLNSSCTTHPVKGKQPNELGLYDMTGNVWEWCSDWYDGNYYLNSPSYNPSGPSTGFVKVSRGGGFESYLGRYFRVSYRGSFKALFAKGYLGLRLAL